MRILVTGASGFIGSHFVQAAKSEGHAIAALIAPSKQVSSQDSGSDGIDWIPGTLSECPWEKVAAFQPDTCVHCAWVAIPGVYLESPENYKLVEDSLLFLKKSRQLGVRRIVSLGTCIEYQISRSRLSELHTPVEPRTTYARCKNQLREALEIAAREEGFENCWARVFYPYGPGEHPSRLCSSLIGKLRRDETISLKTPNSTKDYIFIDDLASALMKVVASGFTGSINLGTGEGITVKEIASSIARKLGKQGKIECSTPEIVDPLDYVVAESSLIRGLGWTPSVNLEQGIERLISAVNS